MVSEGLGDGLWFPERLVHLAPYVSPRNSDILQLTGRQSGKLLSLAVPVLPNLYGFNQVLPFF